MRRVWLSLALLLLLVAVPVSASPIVTLHPGESFGFLFEGLTNTPGVAFDGGGGASGFANGSIAFGIALFDEEGDAVPLWHSGEPGVPNNAFGLFGTSGGGTNVVLPDTSAYLRFQVFAGSDPGASLDLYNFFATVNADRFNFRTPESVPLPIGPVPEPSTIALCSTGVAWLTYRYRSGASLLRLMTRLRSRPNP